MVGSLEKGQGQGGMERWIQTLVLPIKFSLHVYLLGEPKTQLTRPKSGCIGLSSEVRKNVPEVPRASGTDGIRATVPKVERLLRRRKYCGHVSSDDVDDEEGGVGEDEDEDAEEDEEKRRRHGRAAAGSALREAPSMLVMVVVAAAAVAVGADTMLLAAIVLYECGRVMRMSGLKLELVKLRDP